MGVADGVGDWAISMVNKVSGVNKCSTAKLHSNALPIAHPLSEPTSSALFVRRLLYHRSDEARRFTFSHTPILRHRHQ
jgi:hypothetical protein